MKKTDAPRKAAKRKPARKVMPKADADLLKTWQITQDLTSKLIGNLQQTLAAHDASEDSWNRLFGAKDSTVINLQKLVAVLGQISDRLAAAMPEFKPDKAAIHEPISPADMQMLKRWMEEELARVKRTQG